MTTHLYAGHEDEIAIDEAITYTVEELALSRVRSAAEALDPATSGMFDGLFDAPMTAEENRAFAIRKLEEALSILKSA